MGWLLLERWLWHQRRFVLRLLFQRPCRFRRRLCRAWYVIVAVVSDVYEELACCRVGLASFRHGYGVCYVAVVAAYLVCYCWNGLADCAALNHEARDDSVEDCTVIPSMIERGLRSWLVVIGLSVRNSRVMFPTVV